MKVIDPIPVNEAATEGTDWIGELLERAQAGDEAVLPKIREVLQSPEITDLLGNLARRVEVTIVASVTGGNLAMQEGLTKKLADMRAELCGNEATPLERQLVERVVLCWLSLHDAELRCVLNSDGAPDQGEYWHRRVNQAHKRYLAAVKTLAMIRKLAIPIIIGQLNIANKQVNKTESRPDS